MNHLDHDSSYERAPVAEFYPPQGKWTEADYFALPETNRYVELSEGRLIMPPHPTRSHQIAVEELYIRLHAFLQERGLGEVHIAPLPVRLWPGKIREPDIFFISKGHVDRIGEKTCGVPDLVMEILSPGTQEIDRGEKFFEYAQARVMEYWLVDRDKGRIDGYTLRGSAYELMESYKLGETACSGLLSGFEVLVDEVFRQ